MKSYPNLLTRFAPRVTTFLERAAIFVGEVNASRSSFLSSTAAAAVPPAASLSALRHDPLQGKGDNLLVLLHGLGDTPQRYLDFGIRLQLPSTSVVALRAPALLGAGGPLEGQVDGFQWYPAFEDDGELIKASRTEVRRLEGLRRSADIVSEVLQNLWDKEGWSRQTTFLLGFSQGGVVAVEVGCRQTLAG